MSEEKTSDENLKVDDDEHLRYWAHFDHMPYDNEIFEGCRVIRQTGISVWTGEKYEVKIKAKDGMIVIALNNTQKYRYNKTFWEKID